MRRRAFFPFRTAVVVVGVALLPVACDSTLNLGDADAGVATADAPGSGSFPPTCAGACDKVFACGLLSTAQRASCVPDCVTHAPLSLVECIARTPCPMLQATCSVAFDASLPDTSLPPFDSGQEEFEIMNCQSACDSLHFFSCVDAAELTTCRDLCTTAPRSKRNTFYSCGEAAGGNCPNARDCYGVFVGD
ncbi:MAG: hypothetical protein NVS3B10_08610 [Polyangiales bacterium]